MRRVSARICTTLIVSAAVIISPCALADMSQAEAAFQQQDYKQTLSDVQSILKSDPDNTRAMFLKGGALAKLGRLEQAETAYRAMTKAHPDVPQGWNNLGLLLAHRGKLEQARDMLSRAIKVDSKYSPAHESLGDVYVALAQSEYVAAARLQSGTGDQSAAQKGRRLMTLLKSSKRVASSGKSARKAAAPTTSSASSTKASMPTAADTSTPRGLVYAWADAWASQNVGGYLSMYAQGFQPAESGQSRSAWAADRRKHLLGPSYITVQISDLNVSKRGDRARATFSQRYQSNSYRDVEIKALILTRTSAGWRILREGKASDTDWASAG